MTDKCKGESRPCQPGKTVEWTIPAGIELWFDVFVSIELSVTVGSATFGSAMRTPGETYYTMTNNGFHTVQGADIPAKGVPPLYGVISFKGQSRCGILCMKNDTTEVINALPMWSQRTIED